MDRVISDFNGINTYTNPFNTADGNILHCVNLDSDTDGSRVKRAGYTTFLSAVDSGTVNSLFSWTKDDGTTLFVYRASGSSLYYSQQGTGAWTKCGQGTIDNGAHVTSAVLDNTLIIGDGVGSMKYTTDGINFTPIAAAPIGGHDPVEYQGRIYCAGTSSFIFYSTTGTASDWTSDSSSILIGGPGRLGALFKASDRLVTTKNSGYIHRWDGDTLVDLATKLGPSSQYSIGEVEDFRFWINRMGVFTSNANKPQLISNPIQRQITNHSGSGIASDMFDSIAGGVHEYDYKISVGTVTDDFTGITIADAVINYDYKHNEFIDYQYNKFPKSYHSFKDADGKQTFIFGDKDGQVFKIDDAYHTDNSHPIDAQMMFLLHGNLPHYRKDFEYIEFYTSPGCGATVQFCVVDIPNNGKQWFKQGPKIWRTLGDLHEGFTLFRFPPESRGRLMYIKLLESGVSPPWQIYSVHYSFTPISL